MPLTENCDPVNLNAEDALIDVAVNSWKASRLSTRLVARLDVGLQSRYLNQFRFFNQKVEESLKSAGYTFVRLEGEPYETGMAVSVINMDEFKESDQLVIDQVIEPLIMKNGQICRTGSVMLRRVAP